MPSTLKYGAGSTVEVDIEPQRLLAACGAAANGDPADPSAALRAAVEKPLDFPPLAQAVFPGDHVVIAVEEGLPQARLLVEALVQSLLDAGSMPGDICVLQAKAEADFDARTFLSQFPERDGHGVEVIVHDPTKRDGLSYLAADEAGDPIYINRRLVDADVVLPIGCLRLESSPGYYGVNGTLYPAFSDLPTQERFRASGVEDNAELIAKRRQEADEVAWLLGVLMSIQIVPAAGGGVLHVLAGSPESVHRRGNALCREAWSCEVPRRAELVVAAIEGDQAQQSWENVGRALAAASRAVADDGAIALCTELAERPGPALQWLGRAKDLPAALRHIRKHRTFDAVAAHELAQALERVQVYLLSQLDESVVEELGIAPVAAAAEIGRLASRHRSCILLANAQFASPTAADD